MKKTTIMNTEIRTEILNTLPHFCGTEMYYEHKTFGYGFMHLTDGVAYLREKAQCRWLMDLILSVQHKLIDESFQEWNLCKSNTGTWVISCNDGNDNMLYSKDISYSDFPLDSVVLWVVDKVVMLPREY